MADTSGHLKWLIAIWLVAIVAFALLNWLPARRPSDRLRYAVIWTGGAAALSIMLNKWITSWRRDSALVPYSQTWSSLTRMTL